MKFYVRELPQKQYHYQSYDHPILPSKHEIKPNDVWHDIWADYHIDKVENSKGELKVYAIKTPLSKPRKNKSYKKRK